MDEVAREYAALVRRRLGGRVRRVTLFGSRARGDAWAGSDYDVLLIVDPPMEDARDAVLDLAVEMLDRRDALFASIIRSPQEWEDSQGFPLAANIAREGKDL